MEGSIGVPRTGLQPSAGRQNDGGSSQRPEHTRTHRRGQAGRRSASLPAPGCDELSRALLTLADALIEHRGKREPSTTLECFSLGELRATPEHALVSRDIVRDPIGHALRKALKEAAGLLAAELDAGGLRCSFERWTEEDLRRLGPLDAAFDGARTRDGNVWIK